MNKETDRRSDTRLLCADLIELIWRDSSGQERRRIGNLEDISPRGVLIQLEASLPAATRLRIRCGEVELAGHVCYVLFRDKAFFVGVRFDEHVRWSLEEFVPQHLLDPRTLRYDRPVIPMGKQSEPKWVN